MRNTLTASVSRPATPPCTRRRCPEVPVAHTTQATLPQPTSVGRVCPCGRLPVVHTHCSAWLLGERLPFLRSRQRRQTATPSTRRPVGLDHPHRRARCRLDRRCNPPCRWDGPMEAGSAWCLLAGRRRSCPADHSGDRQPPAWCRLSTRLPTGSPEPRIGGDPARPADGLRPPAAVPDGAARDCPAIPGRCTPASCSVAAVGCRGIRRCTSHIGGAHRVRRRP